MKVLHIIDSGGLYGAEFMLLNLIAEQIKLGLDPAIASIGERGIEEKPIEAEAFNRGFSVQKFRMTFGPNFVGALRILRHAHNDGFDLMHSHGYKGNILFGLIPRRLRNLPLISTAHGYTSYNGIKNCVYEWFDSRILKFIDSVVLVNKGMLNDPKLKKLRSVNFHVVNNGIPSPSNGIPFRSHSLSGSRIIEFCTNGFVIGSVGRLSREKDYPTLIEAIHIIHRRGKNVKLVIIGEGEERRKLENQIKDFALSDFVLMPGYLENARDYMKLFMIFVLSSLTEGLPITLLEAMAAGVPAIASSVGGIPEVLEDGRSGFLVPPGNPFELAEAILTLAEDPPKRKELGAQGKRLVKEKFSSRQMAEEYLKIYKEVLGSWRND